MKKYLSKTGAARKQKAPVLEMNDDMRSKLREYTESKNTAKHWAEHSNRLRDEIIDEMAQAETTSITSQGREVAKLSEVVSYRFDKSVFAAAHPEFDLSKYNRVVAYNVLRVKSLN